MSFLFIFYLLHFAMLYILERSSFSFACTILPITRTDKRDLNLTLDNFLFFFYLAASYQSHTMWGILVSNSSTSSNFFSIVRVSVLTFGMKSLSIMYLYSYRVCQIIDRKISKLLFLHTTFLNIIRFQIINRLLLTNKNADNEKIKRWLNAGK